MSCDISIFGANGFRVILVMILLSAASISGCNSTKGGRAEEQPLGKLKIELKRTIADTGDRVNERIEELQNQAQNADEAIRGQINVQIDSLSNMKNALSDDLNRVDVVTSEQWRSFSADVDSILTRAHGILDMAGMDEQGQAPRRQGK